MLQLGIKIQSLFINNSVLAIKVIKVLKKFEWEILNTEVIRGKEAITDLCSRLSRCFSEILCGWHSSMNLFNKYFLIEAKK